MSRAIILWLLCLVPLVSQSSSIRRMSMEEVAAQAELVFEGRVVEKRVIHRPGSRTLRTEVTFEVIDVLKGGLDERKLTLSFLGGEADGRKLEVSDLRIPAVGEQGIYFVEARDRKLVNPLVGWHQGHYLLHREAGTGRAQVRTLDGRPVFGISRKGPSVISGISRSGGAAGVLVQPRKPLEMPMDAAQFKQRIRELM